MLDTNLDDLPIVDWEESVRLAGHKKELAKDLLMMLMNELPGELNSMENLLHKKDFDELLKIAHKLHGAVCYTGTPRLKKVLSELETQLKTNIMDNSPSAIEPLIQQLKCEVDQLFEYISDNNNALK